MTTYYAAAGFVSHCLSCAPHLEELAAAVWAAAMLPHRSSLDPLVSKLRDPVLSLRASTVPSCKKLLLTPGHGHPG